MTNLIFNMFLLDPRGHRSSSDGGDDNASPEQQPGNGADGDHPRGLDASQHLQGEPIPKFVDAQGEVDPEAFDAEMQRLEAERDDAVQKYQRALADYSNFQRRSRENERLALIQGHADVIRSVIPALDNFDRALALPAQSVGEEKLQQGMTLVRDELVRALTQHGLAKIEPARGDEFEPGQHEAMMQVPCEDIDPNSVADVYQIGYKLGDRVLRPAKVTVAVAPPAGAGPGESASGSAAAEDADHSK